MANQVKRLQKELAAIMADPVPGTEVIPADDMTIWNCQITGPANTVYAGAKLKFTINFTPEFPFKAPVVKFITKVYHPNIDDQVSLGLNVGGHLYGIVEKRWVEAGN